MDEGNKDEGERRLPAQQAQQPQPSKVLNDQILSPHLLSEKTVLPEKIGKISRSAGKDQLLNPGGSDGGEPTNDIPVAGATFDEGRFTAGVVKLYEALLKQPIPEDMLRLVDQLGKQERK